MRIYYFGELIADTNKNEKVTEAQKPAANKKSVSEPRLIRDILTERPYAQRSLAASGTMRKLRSPFSPASFTIRNYSHA